MKVLITSKSHNHYDETGFVTRDKLGKGVSIKLDRSGEVVFVPEGQFKFIRFREAFAK
jgi:hypothetical protein